MEIHGIQKMTLLDYPEKVACTIFTARCNFRCPFCHNASLVTHVDAAAAISEEEVFSFLAKRQGILDGVCITGGEPLLQPDIEEFIRKVKELGYQVKLDTNGSNVLRLRRLVEQGLVDYVAMDIKNAPDKYGTTIGIEEYAAIGRWIKGAKQYYLQSFVDSGDLICPGMKGYTKEIMEQALEIVKRNIPNAKLRGV